MGTSNASHRYGFAAPSDAGFRLKSVGEPVFTPSGLREIDSLPGPVARPSAAGAVRVERSIESTTVPAGSCSTTVLVVAIKPDGANTTYGDPAIVLKFAPGLLPIKGIENDPAAGVVTVRVHPSNSAG